MQDELAAVLSIVRDKPRLEIRQTPPVYISQKSNALEVQKWLKDKEFSKDVTEKLRGYSGHSLMSMTREQTEKICGLQEGRRLYSQISIQKSVSGVSILSCPFYKNSCSSWPFSQLKPTAIRSATFLSCNYSLDCLMERACSGARLKRLKINAHCQGFISIKSNQLKPGAQL